MSILATGLEYGRMGLSVIPLAAGSKKPLGPWGEYMHRRAPADALARWFGDGRTNLGIVTGAISGDLAVLDIEPEHVEFARELGLLINTPTVATARDGRHLYCRGRLHSSKLRFDGRVIGDVKAEGGYVVAPPSHTASGEYTWLPGRGLGDLALAAVPGWVSIGPKRCPETSDDGRYQEDARVLTHPVLGPITNFRPDHLIRLLPSPLRRVAEEGWRECGSFPSRSEADFAVLIALAHVGASEEQALALFRRYPIGEKGREHTSGRAYFAHQFRKAHHRAAEDVRGALAVGVTTILFEDQHVQGCARVRATIYLKSILDGKNLGYWFPIVLGPPHDGEISGEWHAVARAFGHQLEPAQQPWTFLMPGEVLAVIRDGAVRLLAPKDAQ